MAHEADSDQAAIDISVCTHGCVHLRFGAATIHLSAQEFAFLMRAGTAALQTLHRRSASRGDSGLAEQRN